MKMTLEFNLPKEEQIALQTIHVKKLIDAIERFDDRLHAIKIESKDTMEIQRAEWAKNLLYEELGDLKILFDI